LAQSTKLSLHERRVTDMVLETKHLPESLARSGKMQLSPDTIAKLIGRVFIQKVRQRLVHVVGRRWFGCAEFGGKVVCWLRSGGSVPPPLGADVAHRVRLFMGQRASAACAAAEDPQLTYLLVSFPMERLISCFGVRWV
jgi:hypothetical protein